jgi:hypothetical protein
VAKLPILVDGRDLQQLLPVVQLKHQKGICTSGDVQHQRGEDHAGRKLATIPCGGLSFHSLGHPHTTPYQTFWQLRQSMSGSTIARVSRGSTTHDTMLLHVENMTRNSSTSALQRDFISVILGARVFFQNKPIEL